MTCPRCVLPILPDQETGYINGRLFHAGCAEQTWMDRLEEAVSMGWPAP